MRTLNRFLKRLQKFRDNPAALWPFVQKYAYYQFVCDRYLPRYTPYTFLTASQTIEKLIQEDQSFIRFGDEAIGMTRGIGLYYGDWCQPYDPALARRYQEVLQTNDLRIMVGFNPQYFLLSNRQLRVRGISPSIWVDTKVFLHKYLQREQVYGMALCFQPQHNPALDLEQLQAYFAHKHIVIVTGRSERFAHVSLGKTTDFVPSPKDNVWQHYDEVYARAVALVKARGYQKSDTLFLLSLACTAKVMAYDLTQAGYQAWDTGQLFERVYQQQQQR